MEAEAGTTQAFGLPAGGFLPVRKSVLSDLLSVPMLQCSSQFAFCTTGNLLLLIPGKANPALELCLAQAASQREGEGLLFLDLYLLFLNNTKKKLYLRITPHYRM